MLSQEQVRALMGPLNPARVASRNQSGRDLSYLEAFDVKATLIRVFGFGNFDAETVETSENPARAHLHPRGSEPGAVRDHRAVHGPAHHPRHRGHLHRVLGGLPVREADRQVR